MISALARMTVNNHTVSAGHVPYDISARVTVNDHTVSAGHVLSCDIGATMTVDNHTLSVDHVPSYDIIHASQILNVAIINRVFKCAHDYASTDLCSYSLLLL